MTKVRCGPTVEGIPGINFLKYRSLAGLAACTAASQPFLVAHPSCKVENSPLRCTERFEHNFETRRRNFVPTAIGRIFHFFARGKRVAPYNKGTIDCGISPFNIRFTTAVVDLSSVPVDCWRDPSSSFRCPGFIPSGPPADPPGKDFMQSLTFCALASRFAGKRARAESAVIGEFGGCSECSNRRTSGVTVETDLSAASSLTHPKMSPCRSFRAMRFGSAFRLLGFGSGSFVAQPSSGESFSLKFRRMMIGSGSLSQDAEWGSPIVAYQKTSEFQASWEYSLATTSSTLTSSSATRCLTFVGTWSGRKTSTRRLEICSSSCSTGLVGAPFLRRRAGSDLAILAASRKQQSRDGPHVVSVVPWL